MAPPPRTLSCPVCGLSSKVIETRPVEAGTVLRRRRVCEGGHSFTSWEFAEARFVRKRDGRLDRFDESRLRAGIEKATAELRQPVQVEAIVGEVVEAMRDSPQSTGDAISTLEIGAIVLRELKHREETGIAAVRFGSVFLRERRFKSVDQLLAAIEELDNLMFYVQKRAREEPFEEMPDSSERRLEPFSYRKLRRSISRALAKSEHNQATDGLVEEISQQAMLEATPIEDDLDDLPSGLASPRRVISAERLGRMVLDRLARLGWLPYARYLSVFDPDSFMNETKSQDKKTQMERERLV